MVTVLGLGLQLELGLGHMSSAYPSQCRINIKYDGPIGRVG